MNATTDMPLLEVKDLRMYFPHKQGVLHRKVADLKAVDGVSFSINKGDILGLVGESGCGKTTVAQCILRIYRPNGGQIFFEGQDISKLSNRELMPYRRQIQFVFQDPYESLDPRQTAGSIVGEALQIHKMCSNHRDYQNKVAELFNLVGLDPAMASRYPHEFSGGQRQRLGIARALSCDPKMIICDEPISALDVSIQAQIINLLKNLKDKLGITFLIIAHDLSVVRHISDYVAVMYLGHIVEITDWKQLYENPLHPYTKALLSAVPIPDPAIERKRERIILNGDLPSLTDPPRGCPFCNRCYMAEEQCARAVPELKPVNPSHHVACIRV